MAEMTTWRCGGVADRVYVPVDIDDLCAYLERLPSSEEVAWLGRGSNVLVRDGGMRGVVLLTREGLDHIEYSGAQVRAEAGTPCARLARETAVEGMAGLEFLAGIPGSVGGALAMNAGCAGAETWDRVESVETVDRAGVRHRLLRDEVRTGYRFADLPEGHGVVAGTFRLAQDPDATAPLRRIREQMSHRRATQPVDQPNCGSVFRNPPHEHAAILIEHSGLKGHRIGGAEVSRRHANFIVTDAGARAQDVERLIEHVRAMVEADSGVRLELEVRILGEKS